MSKKDGGQKGESITQLKDKYWPKGIKGILNQDLNTVRWMKAVGLREQYPTT